MRALVAGGNDETFYVLSSLLDAGEQVSLICENRSRAKMLCEQFDIEVVVGDPGCADVYRDCTMAHPDVFIALFDRDEDNLVACKAARAYTGVKKTVCTVRNPRNVALYKTLGISHPISGALQIAREIGAEAKRETSC